MSKPTWNDLHNATQDDLRRVYKLDQRGLEKAVRKHLYGANAQDRAQLYEKVFSYKGKR